MAERKKKKVAVYRSVSFKKLEPWSANRSEDQQHKSEDLEAAGGAVLPEQRKADQPVAKRNVSVSRKVSKISATTTTAGLPTADLKRGSSTPLSSISPSIRQLTEKFSSRGSARTHGAPESSTLPRAESTRRDRSPTRRSFHEDSGSGSFQDGDTATESVTESKVREQKLNSGSDSGSDSEKKSDAWIFPADSSSSSGKRGSSQISACLSESRRNLTADEEEDAFNRGAPPPCKSHRSCFSTHRTDFVPFHADKWPSVTKIRQLFDERQRKDKQQQKTTTDTCESLRIANRGHQDQLSPKESISLSDRSDKLSLCSLTLPEKHIVQAQSTISSCTKDRGERFYIDLYPKVDHHQYSSDEEADIEAFSCNNDNTGFNRNSFQSNSNSSSSFTGGSHRFNQSAYRPQSPSPEAEAAHKTLRTTGVTSDPNPDLQPPASPSWSLSRSSDASFCSSSLQQSTVRERRDRQGVGLPRDSLHSSHSSSRAPAPSSSLSFAPAPDKASSLSPHWRFSSGEEEEEHTRRRRGSGGGGGGSGWSGPSTPTPLTSCRGNTERGSGYFSRSKNGLWGGKVIGRSSGSEEDSPGSVGPPNREAVRRRSLRKKKKVSGIALAAGHGDYDDHDGESNSDSDTVLTMEHLERHHQQNMVGEFSEIASRNRLARDPVNENSRSSVQQWERISSPVMSQSLPGVSRVSKVNIPPFISSPGDSHFSSRYSSTETLKEEDQTSFAASVAFNSSGPGGSTNRAVNPSVASSSMLSKTYHGNFTMYRSPSFGHGDNFSRTPVRVRPKIVPAVTSSPTVLAREDGLSAGVRSNETRMFRRTKSGEGVEDKDKNRISMSNPDITSETLTLLNFLKTDLSELRVRKTSGGERSGLVEGSSMYRMGSRNLPSGHRPSLKDLTATLRRAKSFTYSDKPTAVVRCYLAGGTTKRSSSEQHLDMDGERDGGRVLVSDREVESDGGDFRVGRGHRAKDYGYNDDDEEVMPTPLQDRYVQEARQVIHDICQMSAREEDDDDDDVDVRGNEDDLENKCFQVKKTRKEKEGISSKDEAREDVVAEHKYKRDRNKHDGESEGERSERGRESMQLEKLDSRSTDYREKGKRESRETEGALPKGDSKENMFYDRSVDELSGHESSLTDEGIVTEPEMGPSDPSERSFLGSVGVNLGSLIVRDVLGQPVTAWKQSALHELAEFKQKTEEKTENSVSCTNHLNEVSMLSSLPLPACVGENDSIIMEVSSSAGINSDNTTNEDINGNNAASQISAVTAAGGRGLEAPATPSAIRRRRKFSPSGNNNTGSDSSNGNNADLTVVVGNAESTVYRSLSDPMPQRRCSVAEEEGTNSFSSVDSNLLGSLSVKGGGSPAESSSIATLSECKDSVASDLSVCSDGGVCDYSGVIRSIVAEPGAMDRLMTDDHGNGKTPKKKSFSDPSRRSDAPLLSQNDPQFKGQSSSTEPISELDQPGQILPSSSEPILSEQREELWESEGKSKHPLPTEVHYSLHGNSNAVKKPRSQSECTLRSDNRDDEDDDTIEGEEEEEAKKFNFDLKLAEALSPRMLRRTSRKRPNRLAQISPHDDPFEPLDLGLEEQEDQADLTPPLPLLPQQSKPQIRPKHVRHASEPATFIPISPPPPPHPLKERDLAMPTTEPSTLHKPSRDEAPSLEDVTQKYILELNAPERETESPGPPPGAKDGTEGSAASEGPSETCSSEISEAGPQKKITEDAPSMPAPQRTKPRVCHVGKIQSK
ncbi:hypothetical protein LDENG_00243840 [Lucifuga dentata]|nr:hypothetical protein LDENG_00243840 [Lucifuga dentata]